MGEPEEVRVALGVDGENVGESVEVADERKERLGLRVTLPEPERVCVCETNPLIEAVTVAELLDEIV